VEARSASSPLEITLGQRVKCPRSQGFFRCVPTCDDHKNGRVTGTVQALSTQPLRGQNYMSDAESETLLKFFR